MPYPSCNTVDRETIDPKQVALEAGGKWHGHYGAAPCPCCQPDRKRNQNALTINVTGGKLLLNCKKAGCDFHDLLAALGLRPGGYKIDHAARADTERKQTEYTARVLARARETWNASDPIAGTFAETYLRGRGITCTLPDNLGFNPNTYHGPRARFLPAMIANVTPTDGIHRTFFDHLGVRLTSNAKMMQGPCSSGAVRLSEAIGPLVVCEGIETGLSLLSGLLDGPHSVWAALSTSGMKGLQLPNVVGDLIIATDGDSSGKLAGDHLARKAFSLGWNVSLMPAPNGQDFNDVLQRGVIA